MYVSKHYNFVTYFNGYKLLLLLQIIYSYRNKTVFYSPDYSLNHFNDMINVFAQSKQKRWLKSELLSEFRIGVLLKCFFFCRNDLFL